MKPSKCTKRMEVARVAEFCLDCWNELNGTHYTEREMVVDHEEFDLCEGCGEWKPCIVVERGPLGRLIWSITHRAK